MAAAFFDAAFGLTFFAGRHTPRTRGIPAAGVGNGVFRLGIFEFGIARPQKSSLDKPIDYS
jgi:hypothetical protein